MNGQPPPPSPVPPIQPAPYYPPPRQGMGCFAKGCLTVLVLGFFFIAVIGGGCWYFYKKTFSNLTSTGPADVRAETPTPEQTKSAQVSRTRLDEAIAQNQETSIEFTGPELNHLLAQNSDLDFLRGRSRIEIADSTMTVALSAPLDRLPWPGMKGRWFNGTVRFSMTYGSGIFQLDLKSAEANGHEFPTAFLSSFNSSFNEAMNKSFQEELARNEQGNEFWNHVKSISLQGDKLVITTKAE
jgi:hypothetical protein